MANPEISLLLSRRSIRQFRPDPVPEELIRRLMEAACAAPSAHNTQPWRFAVLRDPGTRRNLAERMAAAYRKDAAAAGRPAEEVLGRNRRSVERITAAPAAILACADLACLPPDAGRAAAGERLLLAQSVAAAVENLLLAAQAAGLGACWICAPAFCPQAVRASLGLDPGWEPQALVLIGYPAEQPGESERRPIDEVARWI
jgi:coenzyme F420-0:L-glutamate ligase/coenzyme F420-1:gamma-L-glutamate ligase